MLSLLPILFGALFTLATAYAVGNLCCFRLPVPRPIVLAMGAATLSLLVFLILLAGAAGPTVFLLLGIAATAAAFRFRAPHLPQEAKAPLDRISGLVLAAVLALYAIPYFFHALAPEIQPDGVTYHLGLVSEYWRLGAFPRRVGFYEVVPQGLEMLFLFAFSFGRHSAAKLVHFGFLIATLPLMVAITRRMQLPDLAGWLAAMLYFCAPVVAISGTSSYNDAALVFYVLAAFYLLLAWRQNRDDRYLLPAGVLAGFCYAIKFPGILVLPAALLFVLWSRGRRVRQIVPLAAGGLLMLAPWMLRNTLMVGNPVAPLFNRWFPNPYFRAAMDLELSRNLASFGGVSLAGAPWQLAIGGELQGIFGPLLLVMPLGLLALRRREGRLCWLAAALVSIPWFANHGARFLMPAFPFAALAFAMVLPRPAALVCLVLEAVACFPPVLDRYTPALLWRLHDVPWRAALRLQPESEYLWDAIGDYKIASMIQKETKSGERIFSLSSTPLAYVDREMLSYWHSAPAVLLMDAAAVGTIYENAALFNVTAVFPQQSLRGIRFRLTAPHTGEWDVSEVRLFLGDDQIYSSPQWYLRAKPNAWEATAAFDENLATRWRTWEPMRPGMYLEADFDRPQLLTSAVMVSHTPVYQVPFEVDGQGPDGKWRLLSRDLRTELHSREPLRHAVANAILRAGYRYILAPDEAAGNGFLGHDMVTHRNEWGLETPAQAGNIYLFRVR